MKILVNLVLALFILELILLWYKSPPRKNDAFLVQHTESLAAAQDTLAPDAARDDEKFALMLARYDVLGRARARLKRRLARLKHDTWGLKFARDEARQMNQVMLRAHKLIKNPGGLGAFSSVQEIDSEIEKIEFAGNALDSASTVIKAYRKSEADKAGD